VDRGVRRADRPSGSANRRALTAALPGAEATERFVAAPYRFEILEGVSHWVPELASDAVNRFLIEHLAQ
jgi:pimeloyl-ACP methyl ester carboxylesterase